MKRLLIAATMLVSSASFALAAPFMSVETGAGKVLAAKNGRTLYVFKKDKMNKSECYGACAALWPPYTAKAGAKAEKPYSLVKRKNGAEQWAKDGMPLYFYSKDTKKGETSGNGFKGLWHAAKS
jgi:predicted lipoprotein with Yx(FWY)xxD motif